MKNVKIALIGSTGSIGRQVLEVVRANPRFKICSLTAHDNTDLLSRQIREFSPEIACVTGRSAPCDLGDLSGTEILFGQESILSAVTEDADVVFVAVTGFAGLKAVIKATSMGKRVALANKEALVCGGELVTDCCKKYGGELIPVDSEHSALWQALGLKKQGFKRLILTASGGPFRSATAEQLAFVKAADALKHPNWKMGDKITIDCATMLNKGFEVIEAHYLFGAPLEKIDVVVHPQSIIHSMVEFEDNSVLAEMSCPDMLQPIQLALTYPERLPTPLPSLDFAKIGKLEFFELDRAKFPCFDIAVNSLKSGGSTPTAMNAASEVAVRAFLKDEIAFTSIPRVIDGVLNRVQRLDCTLDGLIFTDGEARRIAEELIKKLN